jgi:beta-glucosidase/6-phospho-beta-glucosidase/beta-galactosidase
MPFSLADRESLDRELADFEFPATFDFGASTSGYQVEGGFNGPNEPKNNWLYEEQRGEKDRTGGASRFLENYPDALDHAQWIGLNAFRLGIEWARLQPASDAGQTNPPPFSREAAQTYARIIAAAYERGIFPVVTLHHFTNPLWAGLDLWLDWAKVGQLFGAYVEFAVVEINRALIDEFHKPPIPFFLTINEPVSVPMAQYVLGEFPNTGVRGWRPAMICHENLLMAHVLAYRAIHRLYRERGWTRPTVSLNTWCAGIYAMDKIVADLFLARANGASHDRAPAYLADQRERFRAHMRTIPYLRGPQSFKRALDGFIDRQTWRHLQPRPLGRLTDLAFAGDEPQLIDVLAFDFYDPSPGNNVDFSFPRLVHVRKHPWEWHFRPRTIPRFLESYAWTAGATPLHMVEQGICHRFAEGRAWPHPDGVRRDDAIKEVMLEIVRALRAGRNLRSYYYWSLMDNYEWGSFEPRFGLFGVDFDRDARLLPTDIAGTNAAGVLRLFARAFRARDKNLLREAFLADACPQFCD